MLFSDDDDALRVGPKSLKAIATAELRKSLLGQLATIATLDGCCVEGGCGCAKPAASAGNDCCTAGASHGCSPSSSSCCGSPLTAVASCGGGGMCQDILTGRRRGTVLQLPPLRPSASPPSPSPPRSVAHKACSSPPVAAYMQHAINADKEDAPGSPPNHDNQLLENRASRMRQRLPPPCGALSSSEGLEREVDSSDIFEMDKGDERLYHQLLQHLRQNSPAVSAPHCAWLHTTAPAAAAAAKPCCTPSPPALSRGGTASCSRIRLCVSRSATEGEEEEELCGVCFDRRQNVRFSTCSHRLCADCCKDMICTSSDAVAVNCPFCRKVIGGVEPAEQHSIQVC